MSGREMYILYIDESGDSYYWNEQNHFVLAGVAVHEGQVRNITSKLDEIQNKFFPDINISGINWRFRPSMRARSPE